MKRAILPSLKYIPYVLLFVLYCNNVDYALYMHYRMHGENVNFVSGGHGPFVELLYVVTGLGNVLYKFVATLWIIIFLFAADERRELYEKHRMSLFVFVLTSLVYFFVVDFFNVH